MLTLFLTLILIPALVFFELTIQQWLFRPSNTKNDLEWELYRQRYD
jgi:hypothetical protein